MTPDRKVPDIGNRFWEKVEKTQGCWNWSGAKTDGYGRVEVDSKMMRAHRYAYQILKGPIPIGSHGRMDTGKASPERGAQKKGEEQVA